MEALHLFLIAVEKKELVSMATFMYQFHLQP